MQNCVIECILSIFLISVLPSIRWVCVCAVGVVCVLLMLNLLKTNLYISVSYEENVSTF